MTSREFPSEGEALAARVLVVMKGTKMSKNTSTEIVVRASVASQVRYLESKGFDLSALSAPEVMELQTQFYAEWQKSPQRKDEIAQARAEAEAKAAEARRERAIAAKERNEKALATKRAAIAKLEAAIAEAE